MSGARRAASGRLLGAGAAGMLLAAAAFPAERTVDPAASLFAVVTHKAGFAAGLGHEHLVAAGGAKARLDFDPAAPLAARFELEAAVADLAFDEPGLKQRHNDRLLALGVLAGPFEEVGENDRAKIRASALSPKQLDQAKFPSLHARLVSVAGKAGKVGSQGMDWEATVELTVRGTSVRAACPARFVAEADGGVTVEAICAFAFTQVGIKPYSAALGAVKNQDTFHLVALLRAR